MNKPLVSIVIPTHNRAHLFKRSLECYARQTFQDFELLVLDDDSTDLMQDCCRVLAPSLGLDLKQLWFKKPSGTGFRDGACQINYGIRAAVGKLIITTSPEVMPGWTALEEMVAHFTRFGFQITDWVSARCYLLSGPHQSLIDTVDWKGLGPPEAMRLLPGFYKSPSAEYTGAAVFENDSIDRLPVFGASIFCGMSHAGWKLIGGFPESEVWGSPDPSFLAERSRLGIKSWTLGFPSSTCVHQFHDLPGDIASPRNMEKCMANLVTGPWDYLKW